MIFLFNKISKHIKQLKEYGDDPNKQQEPSYLSLFWIQLYVIFKSPYGILN